MSDHDWLTLHRVRFKSPICGVGNPMPGPEAAEFWRFAPKTGKAADGHLCTDAVWGGFALFTEESAARSMFEHPEAHLPFLEDTVEAWHALVVPYAHRGSVRWREEVETDAAIRTAASDPKGPLVVVTSAGFDTLEPARVTRFVQGVLDVIAFYSDLPANRQADAFSAGPVDGKEGCTISLWADDPSMIAAAYKSGTHKGELAYHAAHSHFDRSSFTRGRVLSSRGTWDGVDPAVHGRAA